MAKSALGKGLASLLPGAAQSAPPPAPPTEEAKQEAPKNFSTDEAPKDAKSEEPKKETFEIPTETPQKSGERHMGISLVELEKIKVNPFQPRREFDESGLEELTNSIKQSGIIQPLVVRKKDDGFELIAGERRLRSAKRAGLQRVPIVIRKSTDRESLEMALVENIQRRDLNCVDQAKAYYQLSQEFSLTQDQIAERVGKDRATVANFLRILKLDESILADLKENKLTFGHAKVLASIEQLDERKKLHQAIKNENLSVRAAEEFLKSLRDNQMGKAVAKAKEANPSNDPVTGRLNQLSLDLTRQYSAKVEFKGNDKRGKIVLHYRSREDLDRIISRMQSST